MDNTLPCPYIRFPEFLQDWHKGQLQNFVTLISGQHLSPEQYDSKANGKPYITGPSDFTNEEDNLSKWSLVESKFAECGDILITVKGSGVGEMMMLGLPQVAMGRQLMAIRVGADTDNRFIYFRLLKSKKLFEALASGNMIPGLSRSDILQAKFYSPCQKEQQKIADFLSSLDKKINLLKTKQQLLSQYKKGVMQQLFSQQIRFKDENGKAFPEWEYKKGNEVFRAMSNKKHNSDLPILAITQNQGAIPRELINYQVQVTDNSVASYKVVEKGDFIISLRSFQGGIEYSNYKGICSPAYIILQPSISINDDFYKYYLKTHNFIQEMKKRLEGIRDGKILSYKYFSEIALPYPCVQEQQRIAHFLQAIDKKIELVNLQIEHTETYKKGLLQQMFV